MNISFTGDVINARCECHQGQLVGRCFVIEAGKEKLLAHTYFKTDADAELHLDGFVFSVAEQYLKKIGLSVESAKTVTIERDEKAVAATEKSKNQSNPHLH